MIYHKTLTNIRIKHGYSHEEFAEALNCDISLIVALESNRQKADITFVSNLRDKLGLHNAPITEEERTTLMESLTTWLQAISYGDMDKAAAQKPQLEKSARESYSPGTINYYDLFAACYYWAAGDMDAHNEIMEALELRKSEFGARHQFYYYRLLGARAFMNHKYSEALKAFITAEKLDKNSEWHNASLYYSIGRCLSDMGYAARAAEYMKMAQQLAQRDKSYNNRPNNKFDVEIDGHMAYNLSKIGRIEEAHAILDKRLKIEINKGEGSEGHGATHFYIGHTYLREKKYCDALKHFEIALQYTSEDGYFFDVASYYKAETLFCLGKIEEGLCDLEKALALSLGNVSRVRLEALKHSALVSDGESFEHMANVIVPKFIEYELYDEAARYYKLLSKACNERGEYLVALKYSNAALEVYQQLYEERVEGGM